MKTILDFNGIDARKFFLKKESYSNIDLPYYFSFQSILDKVAKKLAGKKLADFRSSSPRDFDDINYHLLSNNPLLYNMIRCPV